MKQQKVLLVNTHLTYPGWTEGTLNAAFFQKAKDFFEANNFIVLETKIENGYNADEEVEKHLKADIIILQTPINWFSAPWIYKKYVDEIFNIGLLSQKFLIDDGRTKDDLQKQYGTGGILQGKKFMVSATWNAPEAAFGNPEQVLFKGKNAADVLLPITSNYLFAGMDIVPGYNCFDIYKDGNIKADLELYPTHLKTVFNIQ